MAAPPVYTYELRDLKTNTLFEEVPMEDVSFSKVLNDTGSFSGTIQLPQFNSLGQLRDMYEITTPAHTAVYVFRDSRPSWGGIVWTTGYDSESGKLTLGAADWWSYFDHRRVLPVLAAEAYTDTTVIAELSTVYDNVDQNEIARQLVAQAQAHTGGTIGIVTDTTTSGFLRDRAYPGFSTTPLGDVLRNLTGIIDGPDIRFDVGPAGADGKPVRRMMIGDPVLGQQGAPWVWEYGGAILSYQWPRDATRMRTRSFAIGEGSDKLTPIGAYQDADRYADGWPLLEGDSSYDRTSGDTGTLGAHAQADQESVGLPVVLPTIVVRGDHDPAISDVSPGDDGRVIIRDWYHGFAPPNGTRGLDTRARIVRLDVKPTADGESVTYTMAPLLEGGF